MSNKTLLWLGVAVLVFLLLRRMSAGTTTTDSRGGRKPGEFRTPPQD